jgi:Spy/CpxP family protein refolding chaperone
MKIKLTPKAARGIVVALAAVSLLVMGIGPSVAGASPKSGAREYRSGKPWKRHHPPALCIWKDQQAITQLEITEEQVQQLREADFAAREKRLALKTQLSRLRLQLDKAFSQETPDKKAIRQLAEKVAGIKGQMFVQKTEERLDLGSILTTEQIKQLASKTRHGHRRGGSPCGGRPTSGGHPAERYHGMD